MMEEKDTPLDSKPADDTDSGSPQTGPAPTQEAEGWVSGSLYHLERNNKLIDATLDRMERILDVQGSIRLIGYVMILFGLIEISVQLIGYQAMNPIWEWRMFGRMAERSIVLFIGVGLVFYGRENGRGKKEVRLLQLVYWGTLAAGVIYLLALPLGMSSGFRIYNDLRKEHAAAYTVIDERVARVDASLTQRQSGAIPEGASAPQPLEPEQLDRLKKRLSTEEAAAKAQADNRHAAKKRDLFRKAFVWLPESLIAGLVLIVLWRKASWVKDFTRAHKIERKKEKAKIQARKEARKKAKMQKKKKMTKKAPKRT